MVSISVLHASSSSERRDHEELHHAHPRRQRLHNLRPRSHNIFPPLQPLRSTPRPRRSTNPLSIRRRYHNRIYRTKARISPSLYHRSHPSLPSILGRSTARSSSRRRRDLREIRPWRLNGRNLPLGYVSKLSELPRARQVLARTMDWR